MKNLLFIFGLLGAMSLSAQVPAPSMVFPEKTLLLGGIAHLGNGQIIDNAAIAIENGRFSLVKNQMKTRIDVQQYDTIIRVNGQHIYPGFILPNNTLGITEIDAVKATHDFDDIGQYNPNLRAAIAFNTESKVVHTVRANGVLIAQVTPRGGVISGASGIMALDGWNYQDAAIRMVDGIHVNWPQAMDKNQTAQSRIAALTEFFMDAKQYCHTQVLETNIQFESLRPLFKGNHTLYIHCNKATEMFQVIQFKKSLGIKKVVIVGGYDAHLLTHNLKENNIGVILKKPHSLPMRNHDDIHYADQLPAQLWEAGVLFCLDGSGDMEAMNGRNLGFVAGQCTGYGLTSEQALQSITLNAAKILGIDTHYGSISTGKSATFFISAGPALNMRSQKVTHAWVNGIPLDLTNTQTQLYRKYEAKIKKMSQKP